jgi:cyanophycinase
MSSPGPLALVGGRAWEEGCDFDAELLELSGAKEVLMLPTAAAYENPTHRVDVARAWFGGLGATTVELPVFTRRDAVKDENVDAVRAARFIYLGGGSPLHLRSVLKDSPLWDALVAAWNEGTVIAGASAGAMVLTDPMVDPRGGAFTLGLGLVSQVALITHFDQWSPEKVQRTVRLGSKGIPVAGVPDRTALIREPSGWRVAGVGEVTVFVDGAEAPLSSLP